MARTIPSALALRRMVDILLELWTPERDEAIAHVLDLASEIVEARMRALDEVASWH